MATGARGTDMHARRPHRWHPRHPPQHPHRIPGRNGTLRFRPWNGFHDEKRNIPLRVPRTRGYPAPSRASRRKCRRRLRAYTRTPSPARLYPRALTRTPSPARHPRVLEIPGVRARHPLAQPDARLPAHRLEAAHVEQLARRAVGFRRIGDD